LAFGPARNAAYDLAKLSGKKLVHRVKGSRRYKADPSGVRAMWAYLVLRDKGDQTAPEASEPDKAKEIVLNLHDHFKHPQGKAAAAEPGFLTHANAGPPHELPRRTRLLEARVSAPTI
jgi:hypothetical protein